MDHTPSDIIVVDDSTMLPLGRPTITSALDEHTRIPDMVIFSKPIWDRLSQEVRSWINQAAADWLYRDDTLTEPWTYLIGSNGRILDRWGALFDPAEVSAELSKLPKVRIPPVG